jgi:hypothetical protein
MGEREYCEKGEELVKAIPKRDSPQVTTIQAKI